MMRKVYQKTAEKANQQIWGFRHFLVDNFLFLGSKDETREVKQGQKYEKTGARIKLMKMDPGT